MSLNCLKDHIGIQGCAGSTPPSGIYINQLPGVDLKGIDKLADDQQVNFQGVWDDVQERAVRKFRNDVVAEFNKRFKLKTVMQSVDIQRKIDTSSTTSAATEYRGFVLELNREDENYVASNLQNIYLQTLYLYLPDAVNSTIKVYDLDTETELKTSALTGTFGWNTISVLVNYDYRRLYVCYDSTSVNSIEQDITLLKDAVLFNGSYKTDFGNIEIRGASSTIADKFNITYGNDTFGLTGIFSVVCTFDNLICNNISTFETALLYCLGTELMFEKMYSNRLNEYTLLNKEKAKEMMQHFYDEYKAELQTAINGINLNLNDFCLECNAPIRHVDARV
jgi:hypothetical protein